MKTTTIPSKRVRTARAALVLTLFIGLAGVSTTALRAATASELLEQGIYLEETKGELDEAMEVYRQVVEEGRAGEALAAQAQYRLGVCSWKQRDYKQAAAAFEKLLQEYPDQADLVRMASEYLAGAVNLLPAPWSDGEQMRLRIRTATGYEVGFVRYSIHSDTLDGRTIWRLNSVLAAGPRQASRVAVNAESFKPIHCHWKHSLLGEADTTYAEGVARTKLAGKDQVQTNRLSGVFYDNEQVIQLLRRLPLSEDYSSTLRVFTGLGGARILPIELSVTARETIEVPAGTFDCYRLHMSLVDQTFWYSADAKRYLVKFEAGGITAELTSVEQRSARELEHEAAEAFDFELGDFSGGKPTIEPRDSQSLQKQAKLLVIAAWQSGKQLNGNDWCDVLKQNSSGMPALEADTRFALNQAVAGRALTDLRADTVVFFETTTAGWNQLGGREQLAKTSSGVVVAFADGRAVLVDPRESANLRWNP